MSTWDNYKVGLSISWQFSLTENDMLSFGTLSGDFNPIHTNKVFAQSKGFDSTLVYGVLLCAQFSKLIGEKLPDRNSILTGFQVNFHKPANPNQSLFFSANLTNKSDAIHALEFNCKIVDSQKNKICTGKVDAIWRE